MSKSVNGLATHEVMELLRKRYEPEQGWCLMAEVPNTTGFGDRRCDALAMQCWPSKGIELHGFEIKVSRSDLLKELRDPDKADEFVERCHRWWLVVGDRKLLEGVEVPASWGILAPAGSILRAVRLAPEREVPPWSRGFLAAVVRRAWESGPLRSEIEKARLEGQKNGQRLSEWAQKRSAELEARVKAFDEALGGWPRLGGADEATASNLGRLARLARGSDLSKQAQQIERFASNLERWASEMRAGLRAHEEAREEGAHHG